MYINVFKDFKTGEFSTMETNLHSDESDAIEWLIDYGYDDYAYTIRVDTMEKIDLMPALEEKLSEQSEEEWHNELRSDYYASQGVK